MKVLVADPLSDAGIEALRAASLEVDVRTGLDKPELLAAISEYDGVIVRSATRIDADVLAAAPRLRVVARAGIGLDNVDVPTATARGVIVCNAPQSNVISAAEHTVALLLALARRIPEADRSLRAGEWKRSTLEGVELSGKVLGILGLGRVGTLVAQRCSAFGMQLVAYDPFVTPDRAARMGARLLPTVAEVCELADVVTVHLPKNADTVGIVGEAELKAMKPTARLVNTARGGLVDEVALVRALEERWIAGAALDVFASEPLGESALLDAPNLVLTPHLGASTTEAQDKAGTMVAESVVQALNGEFVPSAVNLAIQGGLPEAVRPFMPLAELLGRLLTALYRPGYGATAARAAPLDDVCVELVGRVAEEDPSAIVVSAVRGLLSDVVHEPVTYVNAPLLADERGLRTSTLTAPAPQDYVSLLRLRAGDVTVAGTLLGPAHKLRLVEVWGYDVDMEPAPHLAFFRYVDRPGVVGLIGQRLGDAGVNIASMQVGRTDAGGQALIAMTVDSAIPPDVLHGIADAIGAADVRAVDLEVDP